MIVDWAVVETMSPEGIENLRVEQLKELQVMEDHADIVKDEVDAKARAILLLEIEKKDLTVAYSKARQNIRKRKSDIEILTSKFWSHRRNA